MDGIRYRCRHPASSLFGPSRHCGLGLMNGPRFRYRQGLFDLLSRWPIMWTMRFVGARRPISAFGPPDATYFYVLYQFLLQHLFHTGSVTSHQGRRGSGRFRPVNRFIGLSLFTSGSAPLAPCLLGFSASLLFVPFGAGVDERMVRRHERGSLVSVVEPLSSRDLAEHEQSTVLG